MPLTQESIFRALELNAEAVEMNKQAFLWGRRASADPEGVREIVAPLRQPTRARELSQSFDEIVKRRLEFLTAYQDAAYAEAWRARVMRVAEAERAKAPGKSGLAEAVARYLFKLMAVKDEYEVARLYTDGSFLKQVEATFEGDLRFEFHLAAPILGRKDASGLPKKTSFGPWMMKAFRLLAALKGLRGGVFDIFGYTQERRAERRLLQDYEILTEEIIGSLTPANHAAAVALASIPEKIRGFGHVKERHIKAAKAEEAALLEQYRNGGARLKMAAE